MKRISIKDILTTPSRLKTRFRFPGLLRHTGSFCTSFRTCVLVGPVSSGLVPSAVDRVVYSDRSIDSGGPVDVRDMFALAADIGAAFRPCLILTTYDLHVNGQISVFGYSDESLKIAVVSLYRLCDDANPDLLKPRLNSVIAHELGHLNGFGHCSKSCVMRTVYRASELDTRLAVVCGHCPRRGVLDILRKIAACAILAAFTCGCDALLSSAFPSLTTPFTCWAVDGCGRMSVSAAGTQDEVSVYFDRQKVLTLRDRGGHRSLRDRSVPAVLALNALANSRHKKAVVVMRTPQGRPAIGVSGSSVVLEILPGDTPKDVSAEALASEWARTINSSLTGYHHEN